MLYHPLNESLGEIRVLELVLPATKTLSPLKRGRTPEWVLKVINLSHRHQVSGGPRQEFVALSYCWGSEDNKLHVHINGESRRIRRNLAYALQAVNSLPGVQNGFSVWADALCINQDDLVERGKQVAQMKDIYRQSKSVMVWLGEADEGSDIAVDFINSLHKILNESTVSCERALALYFRRVFREYGETIWRYLSNLISRRYFSRLWIVQELAMGRKDTPVLCGSKCTTWEKIASAYTWLHLHRNQPTSSIVPRVFREELTRTTKPIKAAYDIERLWKWEKCEELNALQATLSRWKTASMRHVLARTRAGSCQLDLDKVYGILALVPTALSIQIRVDYTLSMREVYTQFVAASIIASGSLDILLQCGDVVEHRKVCRHPDLPSWVPDFRNEVRSQLKSWEPEFNAHAGTDAIFKISSDARLLLVKAVVLGKLDGMSGARLWEEDLNCYQDIQSSKYAENVYGDEEMFRQAIWKALVGWRPRGTTSASHDCILDIEILDPKFASTTNEITPERDAEMANLCDYHLWTCRNAGMSLGGRPLKQWFSEMHVLDQNPAQYHRTLERAIFFLWSRRLATTDHGHVLLAPRAARPGDTVAVILGCSSPLILRLRNDDNFEVIAECYVAGSMEGEIFDHLGTNSPQFRDIWLS